MLQVGGDSYLLQEPLGAQNGGELGVQNFDGDFAVVFLIVGEVHGGCPTAPELTLDRVRRERALDLVNAHRHSFRRRASREESRRLSRSTTPCARELPLEEVYNVGLVGY